MEDSSIFPYNPLRRNPIRYSDAKQLAFEGKLESLLDEYRVYRDDEIRIILRKENNETFKDIILAIKGSKRGNDVYNYRVRRRLEPIRNSPDIKFFDSKNRSIRHKTRALFVDYTYSREDCLFPTWEDIGKDLNRQISKLRSRYGELSVFRTFEAQRDGYPHIHAVLIFKDYEFETFFYNGNWRIQERGDLVWKMGFSDILALSSTRSGLRYVSKYMSKSYSDAPSYIEEFTHALMWAFHKRSYSVSGDFLDLIRTLSNSNKSKLIQVDLFLKPVPSHVKWHVIGFYRGHLGDKWFRELTLDEIREMRKTCSFFDPKYPRVKNGIPLSKIVFEGNSLYS